MDELERQYLEDMARQAELARQALPVVDWQKLSGLIDTTGFASAVLAASGVSAQTKNLIHLASQSLISFDGRMQELENSQIAKDALLLPTGPIAEAANVVMQWDLEPLRGLVLEPLRGLALEPLKGLALEQMRGVALGAVSEQLGALGSMTAAIIWDAVKTPMNGILQYESTLSELGNSLLGLHRVYADAGINFKVTLSDEAIGKGLTHRARFELPASGYEVDLSKYHVNVEAGKHEVDPNKQGIDSDRPTGEPPAQIIKLNTLEAKTLLGPLSVISSSQSWAMERSENSEGLHRFHFTGMGGDEMRRKVDLCVDFIQWMMNNDEKSRERLLTHIGERAGGRAVVNLGRGRPGRKVDAENVEAYQVITAGHWSNDAYNRAFVIWCQLKGIHRPDRSDRNAFKKAMQRRKERDEQRGTGTN